MIKPERTERKQTQLTVSLKLNNGESHRYLISQEYPEPGHTGVNCAQQ